MSEDIRLTTIADELKAGNSVTYFTLGVSMRPLLVTRKTHVTIAPIGSARDNDILLYIRKNGSYVLHRLIKQDGRFYYMRGDNTYGLEPIEHSHAIGRVTHVYRNGRLFSVDDSKLYSVYVAFWNAVYPIRWLCRILKNAVFAIPRRILRWVRKQNSI